MKYGTTPVIHAEDPPAPPADVPRLLRELPRDTVAIHAVRSAISPRAEPENPEHVRVLAEGEADFGPILVHRKTMRVIDGTHRLRAAEQQGRQTIDVRYFDGTEADAFVLSVQLNVRHGMPLTLTERKAAAVRIMCSHPHWSDRSVAQCSGLSPKTVGKLRRTASEEIPQLTARIGRDGRVRPVDSAHGRRQAVRPVDSAPGRRQAAARLPAEPHLRLARLAGWPDLSVRTVPDVPDVRDRPHRGDNPVPARGRLSGEPRSRASAAPGRAARRQEAPPSPEGNPVLRRLAGDPAFRGTESGRLLLRMLAMTELAAEKWQEIINNVPAHCVPLIKSMAAKRAAEWGRLADLRQPFRPTA